MEQDPIRTYLRPEGKGLKLHLGCGDYWFEGYVNIDIGTYGGTDMIYDVRQKLPFQDEVVEIIEAHDFIEHFPETEIGSMVEDWYRLLTKGGRVVATLPEFDELVKKYTEADGEEKDTMRSHFYGVYGDHSCAYTQQSVGDLFTKHGFQEAQVKHIETGKDNCPRMEVTAWKR